MADFELEHMHEQSFNWLAWRNGSIISVLNIPHRENVLIANAPTIRAFAIGYCKADNIPCRPKKDHIAVMFNTGELENWWTHLRRIEFEKIFPEIKL